MTNNCLPGIQVLDSQIYLDTKNKQKMIFVNCYIALKRHSELWHKKLEIIQICLIIGEIDL